MTKQNSFRRTTLFCLTIVFTLCGLVLTIGGIEMVPEHMPATWANTLHPGVLTFIAGLVAIVAGQVSLISIE